MNEIINILKKYFNENDIIKLEDTLKDKQRSNIINDKYFAKVGKNTDKLFFNNLVKEIKLYESNQDNVIIPKLIDSFISEEYCLIVLERITGNTLSNQRNTFNLHLSHDKRLEIANSVLNIKNIKLNYELENNYSRKERLDKYLERSKKYISKSTYLKISSLYNVLSKESDRVVVAHGDLIPTNIMIDNNLIKFIDWEYIAYMPEFYDLTYFLMFSKVNHSLDIVSDLNVNKKEVYIDGIILCLKEIQNFAKLYGKIEDSIVDKNINRWKRELNYNIKLINKRSNK
jgi:thiamine kinase-like enzyme